MFSWVGGTSMNFQFMFFSKEGVCEKVLGLFGNVLRKPGWILHPTLCLGHFQTPSASQMWANYLKSHFKIFSQGLLDSKLIDILGSNLRKQSPELRMTFSQWRVVCVTLRHIRIGSVRLYSMKGGVRVYITSRWEVWDYSQWMVLWELTSHKNWKCETILNEGWCVALHHIRIRSVRLYSLKSGVWPEWEVWDYTQWGVVCDFASHKN